MSKITIAELKKKLNLKTNDDLVSEIIELYKKFPNVKDYYISTFFSTSVNGVLVKYKKIVRDEFFPSRGFGKLRLATARKAINDFKKISTSMYDVADIMVYYVESGVDFTNAYGDISEQFYSSMEKMYESALSHIVKFDLKNEFIERCKNIVDDTAGMGWGFHDTLLETFTDYLNN